jgi:hypothetical protein
MMIWVGILIAAFSGALAAVIAQIIVGFKNERKTFTGIVAVVLFFVFRGLGSAYVAPEIRAWNGERTIREIPFYRLLSENDSETYNRLRKIVHDSTLAGESGSQVALKISDVVADTLPKYLPKASDESVVAYLDWLITRLGTLRRENAQACYAQLYPHQSGDIELKANYMNTKTNEEALEMLKNVVGSAISHPQPPPDSAKSEAQLILVVKRLQEKYQGDFAILAGTAKDADERAKVCDMSVEMFRDIRALSNSDASLLLRYLISQK